MSDEEIVFEFDRDPPIEQVIDLYREGGWWSKNENSAKNITPMIKGSFCFLAAKKAGVMIGMGRVISDGFSDGYIQDVIVKKEYRGQGIGSEIIKRLVRYCREKELEWVGLIAEPETANFYKKSGFSVLKGFIPMRLEKLWIE